jgi:tetratricopeptide (TPR) repeat protein
MSEPTAPGEHPARRVLEQFMRGELRPAERRRVVRHLLAGCAQCSAVTRRLWALGDATAWLEEPEADPESSADPAGSSPSPSVDAAAAAEVAPGSPAGSERSTHYRRLFERLAGSGARRERRLDEDRRQAPRLLAELLRRPSSHRLTLVCDEKRFHNPAIAELLTERSRESAARDVVLALQLAELAVALTACLTAEHHGRTVLHGIAARAWAQLGTARRLNADLAGADRALARAAALFAGGDSGDSEADALDRAELLAAQAELRWQQGRPAEAERFVERALSLWRASGSSRERAQESEPAGAPPATPETPELPPTLATPATPATPANTAVDPLPCARLLLRQCDFLQAAGKNEAAIRAVREAVAALDGPLPSPPAVLPVIAQALHRLAELLAASGRAEEALAAAARAGLLYDQSGDAPNRSRLWRLTGALETALGQADRAEAALRTASERLWRAGLGREAALALLDLALLYAEQGRLAELRQVADDLTGVLSAGDLQKRGELLLVMFQRVAGWSWKAERLSFLRAISRYLSELPRDHATALLRFSS